MLPALALGTERPNVRIMLGRRNRSLVDRRLLARVFGVLGAAEVLTSTIAFTVVLLHGGWRWGDDPSPGLLATASGTAFATIAIGQMANAFACRSASQPVWRMNPFGIALLVGMVGAELALLLAFVGLSPLAHQLGGTWPSGLGWTLAATGAVAVVLADGLWKTAGATVIRNRSSTTRP